MAPAAARKQQPTTNETNGTTLYLAFELGKSKWKLGFTVGLGQRPRQRTIAARDLGALEAEIAKATKRFGLAAGARVSSCYEAGRDGFWLHRLLTEIGVDNQVVDSASIEVNRRAKRAKTDRLDVRKLLTMLIRYDQGETKVWSVVRVPSVEEEDNRHLHRELKELSGERTRLTNRIHSFLAGVGVRLVIRKDLPEQLEKARTWDDSKLPPALHTRILREWERVKLVDEQIRELEADRKELVAQWEAPEAEQVRRLMRLRGIGEAGAWLLVMELFGWRRFSNRRQVGALAGLAPTPHQSGELDRDRGISKAGNRRVRALAIELAWMWVRLQPRSKLARWWQARFGRGSKRLRKIGIVALARKLLVELWRFLETGVRPARAGARGRASLGGARAPAPRRALSVAIYLDSSAIVKLAVREPESAALRRYLLRRRPVVASALARTEVLRALLPAGEAVARGRTVLGSLALSRLFQLQ